MLYCPSCKHLTLQGDCYGCGRKARKLRAPEADDPVFLFSGNYLYASLAEPILEESGLPYVKQGSLGGALSAYVGPYREIYSFFVPYALYEQGLRILDQTFGNQADFRDHLDEAAYPILDQMNVSE